MKKVVSAFVKCSQKQTQLKALYEDLPSDVRALFDYILDTVAKCEHLARDLPRHNPATTSPAMEEVVKRWSEKASTPVVSTFAWTVMLLGEFASIYSALMMV